MCGNEIHEIFPRDGAELRTSVANMTDHSNSRLSGPVSQSLFVISAIDHWHALFAFSVPIQSLLLCNSNTVLFLDQILGEILGMEKNGAACA